MEQSQARVIVATALHARQAKTQTRGELLLQRSGGALRLLFRTTVALSRMHKGIEAMAGAMSILVQSAFGSYVRVSSAQDHCPSHEHASAADTGSLTEPLC